MDPKLHLSDFEVNLLNNSEWILTKNIIVKKAQALLEEVQQNVCDYTKQNDGIFPSEVTTVSPKVSKGENYRGLPWLILDFPRYFNKENIFAIRAMFWWGNFFSTTLHLSGLYKQQYANAVTGAYEELLEKDLYTCVNDNQWQHHFEPENYVPVKNFTASEFSDHIANRQFIKLSRKLLFSEWDHATMLLSENFADITKWLN